MTATEIVAIIAGAAAGIVSVITAITAYKVKTRVQAIEKELESSDNSYYIMCPDCGSKVYLKSVDVKIDEENI